MKKYKQHLPEEFRSTTFVGINYEFLRRVEFYSQHIANISYGYDWRSNAMIRHTTIPFSFTLASTTNITDRFQDKLNSVPALRRSFDQQFIMGMDYTFTYNNQRLGRMKNFFYFRSNHSLAGSLLYGVTSLTQKEKEVKTLAGIPISQFYRTENDLRYYFNFRKKQALVTRIFLGIAVPYGNSDVTPISGSLPSGDHSPCGPGDLNHWGRAATTLLRSH